MQKPRATARQLGQRLASQRRCFSRPVLYCTHERRLARVVQVTAALFDPPDPTRGSRSLSFVRPQLSRAILAMCAAIVWCPKDSCVTHRDPSPSIPCPRVSARCNTHTPARAGAVLRIARPSTSRAVAVRRAYISRAILTAPSELGAISFGC